MTMCTICGGTIRNDRCIKCGIVYKNMTISPKDWYDEYYKSDDVIKYFTEDRKYTYSKVADILYSYKIKTVLDIGTSTGVMIKTLL